MTKAIRNIIQYITEGFIKIFSPNEDSYPAVGLQPYGGTIPHHHRHYDW